MTYKYSKFIRKTDERVMDLFRNLFTINADGAAKKTPILWSDYERLKKFAFLFDSKNDDQTVRLPVLSLFNTRLNPYFDDEDRPDNWPLHFCIRYELNCLTWLYEEANQITEQILCDLPKPIYLEQGDGFDTKVWLNNADMSVKDESLSMYSREGAEPIRTKFIIYADYNHSKTITEDNVGEEFPF